MSKHLILVSLPDDHRAALEATCRRRKVDALEWKRARAFLLPDDGCNPALVCEILDIGPTVLTEWRFAYAGAGLAFFGLKNYSQRQGHLTEEQEQALKARFVEHPARTADEVCVYGLAGFGEACTSSGAVRLMRRLGFEYKKPHLTPSQADEAEQAAFIAKYEALMTGLVADEKRTALQAGALFQPNSNAMLRSSRCASMKRWTLRYEVAPDKTARIVASTTGPSSHFLPCGRRWSGIRDKWFRNSNDMSASSKAYTRT